MNIENFMDSLTPYAFAAIAATSAWAMIDDATDHLAIDRWNAQERTHTQPHVVFCPELKSVHDDLPGVCQDRLDEMAKQLDVQLNQ